MRTMRQTKLLPVVLILAAISLAACGLTEADVQATVTVAQAEAVNTVLARFTEVALLTPSATNTIPATSTLAATNTPEATATTQAATGGTGVDATCDALTFMADVTVTDGEEIAAGTPFTKTWSVRNDGSCTWTTSYTLIFSSGDQMEGSSSTALPESIAPGQTAEISVDLVAPATAGEYTGYWALANDSGQAINYLSVLINVP